MHVYKYMYTYIHTYMQARFARVTGLRCKKPPPFLLAIPQTKPFCFMAL